MEAAASIYGVIPHVKTKKHLYECKRVKKGLEMITMDVLGKEVGVRVLEKQRIIFFILFWYFV